MGCSTIVLDATALVRLAEAQVVQGMAGLSKEQPELIFTGDSS
jgi:hypothetical protein